MSALEYAIFRVYHTEGPRYALISGDIRETQHRTSKGLSAGVEKLLNGDLPPELPNNLQQALEDCSRFFTHKVPPQLPVQRILLRISRESPDDIHVSMPLHLYVAEEEAGKELAPTIAEYLGVEDEDTRLLEAIISAAKAAEQRHGSKLSLTRPSQTEDPETKSIIDTFYVDLTAHTIRCRHIS